MIKLHLDVVRGLDLKEILSFYLFFLQYGFDLVYDNKAIITGKNPTWRGILF